ncbi:SAF domain-containing protein [Nocardioides lacusdianchii]|uniref:SAF domain-containing protein n=1 Tax=Nocardioides lacusdianchii TaxID=2783664 RepID=UPI001CCB3BEA|nr:SAF domain-containing protein [Nocardioides lacusdianchii]
MSDTMTKQDRKAARGMHAPAPGLLAAGERRATQGGQRHRSWGLVTVAALSVLGTGLAVAAWGLHAGQKESVLALGEPVSKGQVIARDDLVTTSVSGVSGAIPVSEINTVVNQTAAVDLVDGQILTSQMFAASAVPASGEATVGLALDPARVPGAGLDPGDVVDVIAVPGGDTAQKDPAALDTPEVLAADASVYSVEGAATAGGQVLVTLVVDAADAARISAYSTQNRVAVVETAPAGAETTGE